MSKFTKSLVETFDFDGDKVTITFKRLKRKHLIALSPHMTTSGDIEFKDQVKFMDAAAEVLPDIIESMTGLVDADGNALTVEEMVDEMYFVPLVSDLMGKVMEQSFVKDEQVKK